MATLINEETAAKILGITKSKLQRDRWLNTGIPYVKIGKCIRYSRETVEAFIASNTITPTR